MLLEQMGGQAEGLNRLILKSYLKKYLYCFEKGVKTWKCSITQTVLLFFGGDDFFSKQSASKSCRYIEKSPSIRMGLWMTRRVTDSECAHSNVNDKCSESISGHDCFCCHLVPKA